MKFPHPLFPIVVAAFLLPLSGFSQLIAPSSITSGTSGSDLFPANQLIDGSGLSNTPTLLNLDGVKHDSFSSGNVAWVTTDPEGPGSDYFAGANPTPTLICHFDRIVGIRELVIWGYFAFDSGNTNGNEARSFEVSFSTDGGTTFGNTSFLVESPGALGEDALRLNLGGPHSANAVRIQITDNHFGNGTSEGGGDRVGLGEIRFVVACNTVTNTDDEGTGSLRHAIDEAPSGGCVDFHPDLSGETIFLTTRSPLVIDKNLTIDGSNLSQRITISGDGNMNGQVGDLDTTVFDINPGSTVTIDSLVVADGRANEGNGGDDDTGENGTDGASGGGIFNEGDLTLRNVRITNCFAGSGGKGGDTNQPADDGGDGGDGGNGGGIFNRGILFLAFCSLDNNRAGDGGDGGRDRSAEPTDGGTGGTGGKGGAGGGLYSDTGYVVITSSSTHGNRAGNGGTAGNDDDVGGTPGPGGFGGGLASGGGTLAVENSTVANNETGSGGADADANPGFEAAAGNGGGIYAFGRFFLTKSTVIGNELGIGGVGPSSLASDQNGGGLYLESSDANITASIVAENGVSSEVSEGEDIFLRDGALVEFGVNLIGSNETVESEFPASNPPGQPGVTGDFVGTFVGRQSAGLAPLGDAGGPTLSAVPLPGSLAIDPPGGAAQPIFTFDQRGFSRIVGGIVDIGAVEFAPSNNTAAKRKLQKKIRKLKKKLGAAKRKKQVARAKRFQKKIGKLRRKLRAL